MSYLSLQQEGNVLVLEMTNGDADNTFSNEVFDEWEALLHDVSGHQGDGCLLITSTHEKTFCNGINLPWLMAQSQADFQAFITRMENFYLRLATLDMPVIAAINGNCYAGGALLAASCDFRLMRADRGRFCLSEVKIKMPFTEGLLAIVRLIPDARAMYTLAVTSEPWGGDICAARGVVDAAVFHEQLMPLAMARAQQLASLNRATFSIIKRGLRREVTALATERGLL